MAGLAKICKSYGSMTVKSGNKTAEWFYDYAQDKPRLKSEMTKEEIAASNKIKNQIKK